MHVCVYVCMRVYMYTRYIKLLVISQKKLLKITYKQTRWKVYKCMMKSHNYIEAVNTATTEIRKSKISI